MNGAYKYTSTAPPPASIERLKQMLDQDLTLSRLAAGLKANPYTLLRHFKAVTTMTPRAYQVNFIQ